MNETLVFLQTNKNDGKFTEIHVFYTNYLEFAIFIFDDFYLTADDSRCLLPHRVYHSHSVTTNESPKTKLCMDFFLE